MLRIHYICSSCGFICVRASCFFPFPLLIRSFLGVDESSLIVFVYAGPLGRRRWEQNMSSSERESAGENCDPFCRDSMVSSNIGVSSFSSNLKHSAVRNAAYSPGRDLRSTQQWQGRRLVKPACHWHLLQCWVALCEWQAAS